MRLPSARDERGFALVVVLLVLGLVTVVAAEFSFSMRLEATAVHTYKRGITAGHLAESGVEQAIREIVAESTYVGLDDADVLTFYGRDRQPLPHLPRSDVEFPGGRYSYRISDEEARINVNTSPPDRLDRLLQVLGLEKEKRDTIVDSVQDWRDPNEAYRVNGAESEDWYLKRPVPYRARNANLDSVAELRQIKGVTPEIYRGNGNRPGLADHVTVKTPGQVNINTAPPVVLQALGVSEAEITQIVQARRGHPLPAVTGQFGGRGLSVATRTFRIDAEGIVDGRSAARVTAIVARLPGSPIKITILEWSGVR